MRGALVLLAWLLSSQQCNSLYSARYLSSDKENAELPVLFHLDDYDRCLLQEDGLYCLGELDLEPIGNSPTYDKIKKYSRDVVAFNRSKIYRGYCVSERCPLEEVTTTKADKNASLRLEQCVSMRTRRLGLRARLHVLQYCTTRQQHAEKLRQPRDNAQQLFLQIVCALLALNVVGTVYDILTNDEKKNGILAAWSVRASWRRLTATYDIGNPRLKQLEPFHGLRVVILLIAIFCHIWVQHFRFYVSTPQNIEIALTRFDGIILSNGTAVIQGLVGISSFLTAYNMPLYSEKHKLTFSMLPMLILKRVIRIAPVHLLLVGFAATYWPAMRSGPLSPVIEEYSDTCRRKFWTHALFLNNIVDKHDICLMPTWFLPVDMHMYILSCALTILLSRRKHQAFRLYAALFVMSTGLCGTIAYVTGWKTVVFLATSDNIRDLFQKTGSLGGYYTSSWAALPACFAGLYIAHLHYDLQEKKYDWKQNKWINRLRPWFIPAVFALIYLMGANLREYRQRWVTSLCVALERPLICCLLLGLVISVINSEGIQRKFFSWRGWLVPTRLSLPVMMCHWIMAVIIAARPVAYYTSWFDVSIDYLATVFYGYLTSMPVTLLVEIPMQGFFTQLMS